jgi:hypothetical protein
MQQQQRVAENPPPNRSGFQHNLTNGSAAILVTPKKLWHFTRSSSGRVKPRETSD